MNLKKENNNFFLIFKIYQQTLFRRLPYSSKSQWNELVHRSIIVISPDFLKTKKNAQTIKTNFLLF
jgi:hypothetical protein